MTQTERRRFLLSRLLAEAPEYRQLAVAGQKQLLRALLNVFKDLDKEIYTRLLTACAAQKGPARG